MISLLVIIIAAVLLPFVWQPDYVAKEARVFDTFKRLQAATSTDGNSTKISISSFNIRLDGLERNPENHFTKRIFRLQDTMERWKADSVGVQEPFGTGLTI
jgi:hypothetical protein